MGIKARQMQGWGTLDGLEFAVELGIDKGKDGYDDKNKIAKALTIDHDNYQRVMGGETILPDKPAAAAAPAWSQQAAPAQPQAQQATVPAWAR